MAKTPSETWYALSPDYLPVDTTAYRTEREARLACERFAARYASQGYYKLANGDRIMWADVPAHCTVTTTPNAEATDIIRERS